MVHPIRQSAGARCNLGRLTEPRAGRPVRPGQHAPPLSFILAHAPRAKDADTHPAFAPAPEEVAAQHGAFRQLTARLWFPCTGLLLGTVPHGAWAHQYSAKCILCLHPDVHGIRARGLWSRLGACLAHGRTPLRKRPGWPRPSRDRYHPQSLPPLLRGPSPFRCPPCAAHAEMIIPEVASCLPFPLRARPLFPTHPIPPHPRPCACRGSNPW